MRVSKQLIAVFLCCVATPAMATIATTTFTVSANVVSACNVTASNLTFSNYNPLGGVQNATTTINVTCTNGTSYNIGLDKGTGSTATITSREMTNGSSIIDYSLFQDTNHMTNWGDTPNSDTVSGTGTGSSQPYTVYGQIFSDANNTTATPSLTYTDTITVTVNY